MRRFLNIAVGLLILLGILGSTYVRDWYDVVDYGARGNDTNDDAGIINQCIEAAAARGGGTVYIPSGQFYVREPLVLYSGIHVKGAGVQACSLQSIMADNVPVFIVDSSATTENFSIEGMTICGNWNWYGSTPPDSSNQHGIYFACRADEDTWTSIRHFKIKDVRVEYMCGHGLFIDTDADSCADHTKICHFANWSIIDNLYIDYCGRNPVRLKGWNIYHHFKDCAFNVRYIGYGLKVQKGDWYWVPAVYVEDNKASADEWAFADGLFFDHCAFQQKSTAYDEDDSTSAAGFYSDNLRFAGCRIQNSWIEGVANKRFLPVIIDSSDAFASVSGFRLSDSYITQADSCICLIDVHHSLFSNVDLSANSLITCDKPYIQGVFGSREGMQVKMFYVTSESTMIFWNNARWDTVSHNLLD